MCKTHLHLNIIIMNKINHALINKLSVDTINNKHDIAYWLLENLISTLVSKWLYL